MIGKNNFKYFLLEDGDKVKANDEWYNPKLDKWEPVDDGEMDDGYYPDAIIGYEYDHDEHKPIRRRNKKYVDENLPLKKIDVVNNDMFEGETVEKDCVVVEELSPTTCVVRLSSDPMIKCMVEYMFGRWEIIEDDYTD